MEKMPGEAPGIFPQGSVAAAAGVAATAGAVSSAVATATAIVVAMDEKQDQKNDPNIVIIKQIAKTSEHDDFLPYLLHRREFFPVQEYHMRRPIPLTGRNAAIGGGRKKEISSFSGNLQKSLAMGRKKRYNRRKTFFSESKKSVGGAQ